MSSRAPPSSILVPGFVARMLLLLNLDISQYAAFRLIHIPWDEAGFPVLGSCS